MEWKSASFGPINLMCASASGTGTQRASTQLEVQKHQTGLQNKSFFPSNKVLHKSIRQKMRDVPSNLSTHPVTISVGTTDAEVRK